MTTASNQPRQKTTSPTAADEKNTQLVDILTEDQIATQQQKFDQEEEAQEAQAKASEAYVQEETDRKWAKYHATAAETAEKWVEVWSQAAEKAETDSARQKANQQKTWWQRRADRHHAKAAEYYQAAATAAKTEATQHPEPAPAPEYRQAQREYAQTITDPHRTQAQKEAGQEKLDKAVRAHTPKETPTNETAWCERGARTKEGWAEAYQTAVVKATRDGNPDQAEEARAEARRWAEAATYERQRARRARRKAARRAREYQAAAQAHQARAQQNGGQQS